LRLELQLVRGERGVAVIVVALVVVHVALGVTFGVGVMAVAPAATRRGRIAR